MAIVINGSGTVTGLAVGGLPDGTVDAGTLATDSVSAAKLADDAVAVAELSATGTASSSTFLRGDNSWQTAGKETEVHVMADDVVGSVANGANIINWSFTPTISGKVFLSHVGTHRWGGAVGNHFYVEYYFNNGSGELVQNGYGVGSSTSDTTNNKGWTWSGVPTTGAGDSTTAMAVTANTACTFRIKAASGATSNQNNGTGKDHIVTAIVFQT